MLQLEIGLVYQERMCIVTLTACGSLQRRDVQIGVNVFKMFHHSLGSEVLVLKKKYFGCCITVHYLDCLEFMTIKEYTVQ